MLLLLSFRLMSTRRSYLKPLFLLSVVAISLLGLTVFSKEEPAEVIAAEPVDDRHRGAHVFGINDTTSLAPIANTNLEWLTLVPWAFLQDYKDSTLTHTNSNNKWTRDYNAFWIRRIRHLRKSGYKVFLKPHVWVDTTINGNWRSAIYPQSESAWKSWSSDYRDFILRYARLAESAGAEMFCVGMELTRLALEKPQFWRDLIADVRKVYSGKITYGANWSNEYKDIQFWDLLDYIGVQAYFPLANEDCVSEEQIATGWSKYLPELQALSEKFDRKILFTEIGYKSTSNGAIRPWEWAENPESQGNTFSPEVQANAYTAFFDTVWDQDWMAGAYFWQMRIDYDGRKYYELDFTPQGKPAMSVLYQGYKRAATE